MKVKQVITLAAVLVTASLAQVQNVEGKGSIDWGTRTVTAVGIGAPNPAMPEVTARPMAIRAARDVALRNALELVKGIQMTSTTTVENCMVSSDVIRTQVDGYIRKFEVSAPRYMSDKTIEITATIPMDNELANSLLPPTIGKSPAMQIMVPAGRVAPTFTGLIIDARGTGAIPALIPKIIDEDGKEVYGSAYVTRDWAVKWGMAGYAKSPEQASSYKDRIGPNPGTFKVVRATGASRTDLVISNNDALDVRAAAKAMKFLADCRVVVILD